MFSLLARYGLNITRSGIYHNFHLWHFSSFKSFFVRSTAFLLLFSTSWQFVLILTLSMDFPSVIRNCCCFLTVSAVELGSWLFPMSVQLPTVIFLTYFCHVFPQQCSLGWVLLKVSQIYNVQQGWTSQWWMSQLLRFPAELEPRNLATCLRRQQKKNNN